MNLPKIFGEISPPRHFWSFRTISNPFFCPFSEARIEKVSSNTLCPTVPTLRSKPETSFFVTEAMHKWILQYTIYTYLIYMFYINIGTTKLEGAKKMELAPSQEAHLFKILKLWPWMLGIGPTCMTIARMQHVPFQFISVNMDIHTCMCVRIYIYTCVHLHINIDKYTNIQKDKDTFTNILK